MDSISWLPCEWRGKDFLIYPTAVLVELSDRGSREEHSGVTNRPYLDGTGSATRRPLWETFLGHWREDMPLPRRLPTSSTQVHVDYCTHSHRAKLGWRTENLLCTIRLFWLSGQSDTSSYSEGRTNGRHLNGGNRVWKKMKKYTLKPANWCHLAHGRVVSDISHRDNMIPGLIMAPCCCPHRRCIYSQQIHWTRHQIAWGVTPCFVCYNTLKCGINERVSTSDALCLQDIIK